MLIKLLNQGRLLSILYPLRLTALVSSYNITLETLIKVKKNKGNDHQSRKLLTVQ